MDKVLLEKELPIKMVAYGRCFRTEAGAAGAAGKGLYRVHQFTKVQWGCWVWIHKGAGARVGVLGWGESASRSHHFKREV
jgi:seryl-tRNA synthetase